MIIFFIKIKWNEVRKFFLLIIFNKQILLLSLSNLFKQQARIREYYAKHYFAQTNDTETSINKRDAEFMKQLTEVIEKNLSNADIDVLQIASTLAMSRRTLYSKVKALTGQSVVEFIRNYRLRKAAFMPWYRSERTDRKSVV